MIATGNHGFFDSLHGAPRLGIVLVEIILALHGKLYKTALTENKDRKRIRVKKDLFCNNSFCIQLDAQFTYCTLLLFSPSFRIFLNSNIDNGLVKMYNSIVDFNQWR